MTTHAAPAAWAEWKDRAMELINEFGEACYECDTMSHFGIAERRAALAAHLDSLPMGPVVAWQAHYVDRHGMPSTYTTPHHELAVENDATGAPVPLYRHPKRSA